MKRDDEIDIEAAADLRRQLVDAAVRETGANPRQARRARKRRTRRRATALVLAGAIGAAGVAAAAELIAIGQPEQQKLPRADRDRPSTDNRLDVTAKDEPLSWGVDVYRSKAGGACAVVGQLRAGRLGLIRDGTFRPFESDAVGSCGDLSRMTFVVDSRRAANRTVIFGRARGDVVRMRFAPRGGGEAVSAPTGPRGAFLFVFEGSVDLGSYGIDALGADGRVLPG